MEAYEYYLRARQHLPRMTRPDLEKSGESFQRAIDLDTNYGPAFAGLAMVHATLYEWFGARDENLATAEQASVRALELAPSLAEAHVARGCALALSRRYGEAAGEFEAAIRLNPNLFDAYYHFARRVAPARSRVRPNCSGTPPAFGRKISRVPSSWRRRSGCSGTRPRQKTPTAKASGARSMSSH